MRFKESIMFLSHHLTETNVTNWYGLIWLNRNWGSSIPLLQNINLKIAWATRKVGNGKIYYKIRWQANTFWNVFGGVVSKWRHWCSCFESSHKCTALFIAITKQAYCSVNCCFYMDLIVIQPRIKAPFVSSCKYTLNRAMYAMWVLWEWTRISGEDGNGIRNVQWKCFDVAALKLSLFAVAFMKHHFNLRNMIGTWLEHLTHSPMKHSHGSSFYLQLGNGSS